MLGTEPQVKYVGCRNVKGDLFEVVVERPGQKPYHLNARNDIYDHSPTGVAWGYGGSGPAQCALGVLADYFGGGKPNKETDQEARRLYMDFKWLVIQRLSMDMGWELSGSDIAQALTKIQTKHGETT